jgi:hypothetical protein
MAEPELVVMKPNTETRGDNTHDSVGKAGSSQAFG